MAPVCEVQILDGGSIVVLRWLDAVVMNKLLDPISNRVDGPIKNRLGHNFPFHEMNATELKMVAALLPKSKGKCSYRYLIACMRGDAQTLRHELCHAKYFVSDEWRALVESVWHETLTYKERLYLSSFLARLKYQPSVHIDEFQAYALTEPPNFFGIEIDEALEALKPLHNLLVTATK